VLWWSVVVGWDVLIGSAASCWGRRDGGGGAVMDGARGCGCRCLAASVDWIVYTMSSLRGFFVSRAGDKGFTRGALYIGAISGGKSI
jgi:hypothetical protein